MRTTRIKISNLFGIKEFELDNGSNVELTGTNGTGKSSVLDAIRYALTNNSGRDVIIHQGEKEGEIIIEAGNSLRINRRKRTEQADYKSVKQDGREVSGAESFLRTVFTPMQLDPVAFCQMGKKEQNRLLLDMIDYKWDLNTIREWFGEIPEHVDYSQNILQVLSDIQAESGDYFQARQALNREYRGKRAVVEEIAAELPQGYDAQRWEDYDLGAKYREIEKISAENSKIERARLFLDGHDGKVRGIEADYLSKCAAAERDTTRQREQMTADIARMEEQMNRLRSDLGKLDWALGEKKKLYEAEKEAAIAKLGTDTQTARIYADKPLADITAMQEEADEAGRMKGFLREYARMQEMRSAMDELKAKSEALTGKIELARRLPGEILQEATIPVPGLTVEDGVPLINGLPVTNLSEGEKLNLCVDVALAKPNTLQIILIDGAEKLSDENRAALYARCKEHGLQFIATRTTNESELEVHYL